MRSRVKRQKCFQTYHIGQQKFVINLKWPSNFLHGLKWPLKIWHFRPSSCMSNNSILLEFWRLLRFLLTFCRVTPQFYPNPQKGKAQFSQNLKFWVLQKSQVLEIFCVTEVHVWVCFMIKCKISIFYHVTSKWSKRIVKFLLAYMV